jgi:hypothetical protein
MRASTFILVTIVFLGLFLWVTLSGALLIIGGLFWLFILIITMGYSDTMILYLLGAREVRSSDEQQFFEAVSQEAYKLAVDMPRLYFYNGFLERAFILQNRQTLSIILNKELLDKCSSSELKAISFELLLQVKKGMASKRTKTMFLLGFFSWTIHSLAGLLLLILPFKDLKKVIDWTLSFLLHPALNLMFKLMMGGGYYKKLSALLMNFPLEKELLDKVGLKLRKPYSYYSLPSRKLLELSSIYKSSHYQNIIALEFLPHEWDYLFTGEGMTRAE